MSTGVNRSTDQQVNKSTQDNTNLWQCSCMQLHARADFKRKKIESTSIFQSLRRHKPVNTEQTKLQEVYPLLALWCVCGCVCGGNPVGWQALSQWQRALGTVENRWCLIFFRLAVDLASRMKNFKMSGKGNAHTHTQC